MKTLKYLFAILAMTLSFNAFADDCKTFAVKKLEVTEKKGGGWIKMYSKNGAIYGRHGRGDNDAVSWSFASPASQHWYNLALTSLTTGMPVTVCQASDLAYCNNGPAPYTCRFSSMYMVN